MKATGIVRRIDDLGRVVVPKEIRRTLRIGEGDPLEIFTDREGEIILKKYSPIGELSAFAGQYAESLAQTAGCLVCICDMDQVVAASGGTQILARSGDISYIKVTADMKDYCDEVICPIICEGDVIGAVAMLNKDEKRRFGEVEQRVAYSAADFLGRQMEQ